jgi:hypothetical protein
MIILARLPVPDSRLLNSERALSRELLLLVLVLA